MEGNEVPPNSANDGTKVVQSSVILTGIANIPRDCFAGRVFSSLEEANERLGQTRHNHGFAIKRGKKNGSSGVITQFCPCSLSVKLDSRGPSKDNCRRNTNLRLLGFKWKAAISKGMDGKVTIDFIGVHNHPASFDITPDPNS